MLLDIMMGSVDVQDYMGFAKSLGDHLAESLQSDIAGCMSGQLVS
jgi:hypothetical protein